MFNGEIQWAAKSDTKKPCWGNERKGYTFQEPFWNWGNEDGVAHTYDEVNWV